MTERAQSVITDSVGSLVEAAMKAAGKKLATHRLLGMRIPSRPGAITVDVTQNSNLFCPKKGGRLSYRGVLYLAGPEVVAEEYEPDGNATGEQVTPDWLALYPFVVDGEELLRAGSMVPNPLLQYRCLICSRTYVCRELLARARGYRHACGACATAAENKVRQAGGLVTGAIRQKILMQFQLRHVVCTMPPHLTEEELNAIRISLAKGPAQRYSLPRPICMFQPGALECLWEPEETDELGKQLIVRCRNANQTPIPLRMALDIYGRPPVVMPGLLGVVLLLPTEMCGWREVSGDQCSDGWKIVLPRNTSTTRARKVEEV